ncbi:MAG: hypothetical protein H6Q97_1035 [Nitrospirae bacterium]|nr:hypothetical protein [Nitrospirota bacterium]
MFATISSAEASRIVRPAGGKRSAAARSVEMMSTLVSGPPRESSQTMASAPAPAPVRSDA